MSIRIDLQDEIGEGYVTLSRKSNGKLLREKLNLDQLELQDDKEIIIDIPLYVISFNPSYFIGLSRPSIKKYKTKENFLKKYKFECDKFILRDIDNNIDYALKIIKKL